MIYLFKPIDGLIIELETKRKKSLIIGQLLCKIELELVKNEPKNTIDKHPLGVHDSKPQVDILEHIDKTLRIDALEHI